MSGTGELPDDPSMLAAEYVLGVLDGAERRAVAARAGVEPELAAEIATWERLLAPLALLVPPVEPPPELWARLERAIGGAANDNAAAVRRWRAATFASLALAACLAVVAIVPRGPQAPASVAVASIGPLKAGTPAFIARVLPNGGLSIAAVAPGAVPSGRDLELWALPPGATQVTSLGVLPASGRMVPPSALIAPGGKLLVSLEPKGGSPTGKPTGPVLYGGVITRL